MEGILLFTIVVQLALLNVNLDLINKTLKTLKDKNGND